MLFCLDKEPAKYLLARARCLNCNMRDHLIRQNVCFDTKPQSKFHTESCAMIWRDINCLSKLDNLTAKMRQIKRKSETRTETWLSVTFLSRFHIANTCDRCNNLTNLTRSVVCPSLTFLIPIQKKKKIPHSDLHFSLLWFYLFPMRIYFNVLKFLIGNYVI